MASTDVYSNYQARINGAISAAVSYKQNLGHAKDGLNNLYAESAFKRLPKYKQEALTSYAYAKWQSMLDKYTLLLTIGLDGRKVINKWDNLTEEEKTILRTGGRLESAFYWLEEKIICSDDGVITTIMTPTDKVYFHPSFGNTNCRNILAG
jgi:hypothetical protein